MDEVVPLKVFKIFVSCPGDVEKEKQTFRDACYSVTKALCGSRKIEVKTIDWRNDVVPLITGESAQAVIDKQIQEYDYDVYVGILWKRFGDKQSNGLTPTEEEFEDAIRRRQETGRPVIQFYFKIDKYYPNNPYEAQQALEIQKFKEKVIKISMLDFIVNLKGKIFREKYLKAFCTL